ncbi:MAG: ribonuclease HI family protein [Pseudomonadota bacterium]
MNEIVDYAYHAERVAARRIARRDGLPELQALESVLAAKAGAQGLAALIEARRQAQAAQDRRRTARLARQAERRERHHARHAGQTSAWRAWFDGSARPNPGRCSIGGVLEGPDGQRLTISRAAGEGSSSDAEYRALIAVLEAAVAKGARGLTVYGDSRVVIDDMQGANSSLLAEHRVVALALLRQCGEVVLQWVPRHKNPEADALSQGPNG